jgi:hypothetical protein
LEFKYHCFITVTLGVVKLYIAGGCLGMILFLILMFSAANSGNGFLIFISLVGMFVCASLGLKYDNKRKEEYKAELQGNLTSKLNNVKEFKASQVFVADDSEAMIAIDETNKKICIIDNVHKNDEVNADTVTFSKMYNKYKYKENIYSYKDILKSQIVEDGVSVTSTSRGSQIGGALLGGVLAGGVGAIIGGLSGSQTTVDEVKKIQLQVVLNDTKKPYYEITFKRFETKVPKNRELYKKEYQKVFHWHNLISVLIKQADELDTKEGKLSSPEHSGNISVADELIKLNELFEKNIINKSEFEEQKRKILS